MPVPYVLELTPEQVTELEDVARHAPKPFQRERAIGILRVYRGESIRHVATHIGLDGRSEHTVKRWITWYLERGLEGLEIRAGRGRHRRSFPPQRDAGAGSA